MLDVIEAFQVVNNSEDIWYPHYADFNECIIFLNK